MDSQFSRTFGADDCILHTCQKYIASDLKSLIYLGKSNPGHYEFSHQESTKILLIYFFQVNSMDPVLSSQFSDWLNLRGIQAAGGIKRNPKKLSA